MIPQNAGVPAFAGKSGTGWDVALESFIPTPDDIIRAPAIVGAYTRTRLDMIAARPGNPMGAQARPAGGALALIARRFPSPNFNCVYGFCDDDIDHLPGLLDWYAEGGAVGRFQLAPGRPLERTFAALAAVRYAQTGFHATFAGPAALPDGPSPGVEVRKVGSHADLETFADVYHLGWAVTGYRVPIAPWLEAPGWSLYLGFCDGAPAGCAVLYLNEQGGYLADSAVDPAFRGRGVHRALLDRRCADAAMAGAARLYSGAEPYSASHRNMLRKGLALLYTEAVWTGPQPKAAG
jgi:ribosomal protein S18 acetylase RimI-like enzyme